MKKKKNFTLIELMVSCSILVFVGAALLLCFVRFILLNQSNSNLVTAIGDAQSILEDIRALDYGDISSYSPSTFANLNQEDITVARTIGTRISEVTVNVSWMENQRQKSYSLSTRFAR